MNGNKSVVPTLRRSRRYFERREKKGKKNEKNENDDGTNIKGEQGSPLSWIFQKLSRSGENLSESPIIASAESKSSSVFVMLSSGDVIEENVALVLLEEMLEEVISEAENKSRNGDLRAACLVVHCKALKKWKEFDRIEDWRVIIQSVQLLVNIISEKREDSVVEQVKLPEQIEYSYKDCVDELNNELIRGMHGLNIL
ncbi:hypothetical protein CANINC_002051 [Pichia inconspicua]|uniref:Uncharacterized protein n=1 Tax=Pichia inconspicua TaxID=52247 RepID=A0A4T0X2K2_9ASCO|nr:hypothetical protein CANINC_002051 [[Candida] inconspicua]